MHRESRGGLTLSPRYHCLSASPALALIAASSAWSRPRLTMFDPRGVTLPILYPRLAMSFDHVSAAEPSKNVLRLRELPIAPPSTIRLKSYFKCTAVPRGASSKLMENSGFRSPSPISCMPLLWLSSWRHLINVPGMRSTHSETVCPAYSSREKLAMRFVPSETSASGESAVPSDVNVMSELSAPSGLLNRMSSLNTCSRGNGMVKLTSKPSPSPTSSVASWV
mmetsp:Transcript_57449/g.128276  ORF Transcript_57449/g.128276 Transcript_57449/m.128276 type:complete len:223 (+) Transcript_57449:570-1238(+)